MKTIPSTGFAGFDRELRAIFEIDAVAARSVVEQANGDIPEVVRNLDRDVIRAAVALEDSTLFSSFSRAYPQQLIPVLNEARVITRGIFKEMLSDDVKLHELDLESRKPVEIEANLNAIETISGVLSISEWKFDRDMGSVIPSMRVSFTNPGDRELLSISLDWDDAIYVCYRILQEIIEDSKNIPLIDKEAINRTNLKQNYGDRVAKRISNMIFDLKEIRSTLCTLGFSPDDFAPD